MCMRMYEQIALRFGKGRKRTADGVGSVLSNWGVGLDNHRRRDGTGRNPHLKAISWTVLAGLMVQVGRPLISLITLPLLLSHLGQSGLGIWMIALSLMGLAGFVSAGLSVSVVTMVSRTNTEGLKGELNCLLTSATLIAALWGLAIIVLIVPFALMLDWSLVLGQVGSTQGDEFGKLMATLAFVLGFGIVAGVPRQFMVGMMQGYVAHLLDFSGVVAGTAGLFAMIILDAPLWGLGLAFMAPSYLALFVGGLFYLRREGIAFAAVRQINHVSFMSLARDSARMAGYQSAYAISTQSDLLLIGFVLGAPASAVYGVAQRVFSLPILISATVNYAQWPAIARADAASDHALVSRMFWSTLLIGSLGSTLVATIIAMLYRPLLNLWLGHNLDTDKSILIGMVAWVMVATMVNTCDSVLRARNETSLLMRSMMAMAVVNIATTLYLLPLIGPAGAIWGSVIGFSLALLLPYTLRLSTESKRKHN